MPVCILSPAQCIHLHQRGLPLPYLQLDDIDQKLEEFSVSDTDSGEFRLSTEIRMFYRIVLLLTLICAVCECFCYFVQHRHAPYTWPFIPFYDNVDIRCYISRFHHFHHLDFFSSDPRLGSGFGYPAPGAVLYEIFYLTAHPIVSFFIVSLGLMSLLGATLFRSMRAEGLNMRTTAFFLAFSVVLSYPLWFEFLLGNLEVLIFLMVAAGILAFLYGHSYTAATLIAVAGSVKLVPFIFLGLLIARKQYREAAYAILLAGAINVISLWLICPDIATSWRGINTGLDLFRDSYMLHFRSVEMGFDHSLFGAIKQFTLSGSAPATISRVLSWYTAVTAIAGVLLFFGWIRRLPVLNQIICLTVAEVLLPPLSHDYTLLSLYISWGLLIVLSLRAAWQGRRLPGLTAVFVCFAILMSPQTEAIAAGQSYGGQIKCLVLLVLMGLALRYSFVSEFDGVDTVESRAEVLVAQWVPVAARKRFILPAFCHVIAGLPRVKFGRAGGRAV